MLGIPPKFKLYGTGTLDRVGELGLTRQWNRRLGKYYFNDAGRAFVPSSAWVRPTSGTAMSA